MARAISDSTKNTKKKKKMSATTNLHPLDKALLTTRDSSSASLSASSKQNDDDQASIASNKATRKKLQTVTKKRSSNSSKLKLYRDGRWTRTEKRLFLQGLMHFGKGNWKEVSKMMKTRSPIQVKSHGQKIIKKIQQGQDVFGEAFGEDHKYHDIAAVVGNVAAAISSQHQHQHQQEQQRLIVTPPRRNTSSTSMRHFAGLSVKATPSSSSSSCAGQGHIIVLPSGLQQRVNLSGANLPDVGCSNRPTSSSRVHGGHSLLSLKKARSSIDSKECLDISSSASAPRTPPKEVFVPAATSTMRWRTSSSSLCSRPSSSRYGSRAHRPSSRDAAEAILECAAAWGATATTTPTARSNMLNHQQLNCPPMLPHEANSAAKALCTLSSITSSASSAAAAIQDQIYNDALNHYVHAGLVLKQLSQQRSSNKDLPKIFPTCSPSATVVGTTPTIQQVVGNINHHFHHHHGAAARSGFSELLPPSHSSSPTPTLRRTKTGIAFFSI